MHAVVCRVAVCGGRQGCAVQEDERKDKECAVHHNSVGLKKVIAQKNRSSTHDTGRHYVKEVLSVRSCC